MAISNFEPKILANFQIEIPSLIETLEGDAGQEAREWGRKARESWNLFLEREEEGEEEGRKEGRREEGRREEVRRDQRDEGKREQEDERSSKEVREEGGRGVRGLCQSAKERHSYHQKNVNSLTNTFSSETGRNSQPSKPIHKKIKSQEKIESFHRPSLPSPLSSSPPPSLFASSPLPIPPLSPPEPPSYYCPLPSSTHPLSSNSLTIGPPSTSIPLSSFSNFIELLEKVESQNWTLRSLAFEKLNEIFQNDQNLSLFEEKDDLFEKAIMAHISHLQDPHFKVVQNCLESLIKICSNYSERIGDVLEVLVINVS